MFLFCFEPSREKPNEMMRMKSIMNMIDNTTLTVDFCKNHIPFENCFIFYSACDDFRFKNDWEKKKLKLKLHGSVKSLGPQKILHLWWIILCATSTNEKSNFAAKRETEEAAWKTIFDKSFYTRNTWNFYHLNFFQYRNFMPCILIKKHFT